LAQSKVAGVRGYDYAKKHEHAKGSVREKKKFTREQHWGERLEKRSNNWKKKSIKKRNRQGGG